MDISIPLVSQVEASLIASQMLFAKTVEKFLENIKNDPNDDYKDQSCRKCIKLLCERVEDPALVLALSYFVPEKVPNLRNIKNRLESMIQGTGHGYSLDQYLEVIKILHEHLLLQIEAENSNFAASNCQKEVVLTEGEYYKLEIRLEK